MSYPLLTAGQLRDMLEGIPNQTVIHLDIRIPTQSIRVNGPLTGVVIGRGKLLQEIISTGLEDLEPEKLYVLLEHWKST